MSCIMIYSTVLAVLGFGGTGSEVHIPHYLRHSRAHSHNRVDDRQVLKSAPPLSSTYYLSIK